MATKTPTRPKQRQSTQQRSWQNLTDRRKLRHLENTLDKAITKALQEGGIESHEDFKAYVESFSELLGKAPITVELCEGGGNDDEIRGYRFYLTSDPSQRTSGKYLIKNLEGVTDRDENYFTPSNIAEMFGFKETEFSDLDTDTDAELETGRAKTIFLRVIQPLRFPGATTTPVSNLMVQTVDARGQNRLYTFDIVHSSNPRYVGVQILPAIARSQTSPVVNNLNITPDRIQTGLSIAIMRGYTSIDDPVVAKVRQLLELMRTENMIASEAAYSVGIPLDVLASLARLVREERGLPV